jgi:predicted acetyltransferase
MRPRLVRPRHPPSLGRRTRRTEDKPAILSCAQAILSCAQAILSFAQAILSFAQAILSVPNTIPSLARVLVVAHLAAGFAAVNRRVYTGGVNLAIRRLGPDDLGDMMIPIASAFGLTITPERIARSRSLTELDLRLAAYDGDQVVGAAGSYSFEMTAPGGAAVETAGLTMVGVLATHRRRGVLTRLMREYLDEARARGQSVSALFASEGPIYGRFGYGLASFGVDIDVPRDRRAFVAAGAPEPAFTARFLTEDEAAEALPPIWDRVRATTPGMLSRSPGWWRARRIGDPEWSRAGRPSLSRMILSRGGRPSAYALYRLGTTITRGGIEGSADVVEAIADSPEATRALWRFLFDLDLVVSLKAVLLPVDHPIFMLSIDPRWMNPRVSDALWVRLVDVGAALSKRAYGEGGPLVLEVADAFCPWNEGRYRLAGGVAERTTLAPDLSLGVTALGSTWLGAVGFTQLAAAGLVTERTPGALRRADALFRGDRAPWCPEIF